MSKELRIEKIDRALRERNFNCFADLIRQPDPAPEVRDHLAEVVLGLLTGNIRFPRHRPKREKTEKEAQEIAKRVVELHRLHPGWEKLGAAVKRVTQERGCSESKVTTALRNYRGLAEEYWDRVLEAMWDEAYMARRLGEFTDYEVEAEEPDEDWEVEADEPEEGWAEYDYRHYD